MQDTLLIELLTEELPPKALANMGRAFADSIGADLHKHQLRANEGEVQVFASPRRLGVRVPAVLAVQPEQIIERRGPAVAAGLKDGQPTPALAGFARSCGVEVSALGTLFDGKQDVYVFRAQQAGKTLATLLPEILQAAIKKLPIPKVMRWGDSDVQFVRPVHALTVLHGADIVPASILGLAAGRISRGHRFLSTGDLTFAHADDYARTLHEQGRVIASFAARRAKIEHDLHAAAHARGATIAAGDALLDEVTGLVEWPVVYVGQFDADFLQVPQECLILTMQQNQKYFPLLDANGKLLPTFLVVSNLETADPSQIIRGNERVLRARLSDAKFFFEQDQKHRLDSRVEKLASVVHHNLIGTQLARTERLVSIAGHIAAHIGADVAASQRAARLAKADLVSDMVGEFPELQGVMGAYYAALDGETPVVAAAIEAHYHPRFAGDTLPAHPVGLTVALADKLETLVGIYGIGLIPTGDKDPFGLRRAALGVLRMLVEAKLSLDVPMLLQTVADSFPAGILSAEVAGGVYGFMLERLRHYLGGEFDARNVDAVLALRPRQLDTLTAKLGAVAAFRTLPEAIALSAADKRVRNILKKADVTPGEVKASLLAETAEQALYAAIQAVSPRVATAITEGDYPAALKTLASLQAPIDAFFTDVMVNAEDLAVRANRLAMLSALAALMNQVAEIALLAE